MYSAMGVLEKFDISAIATALNSAVLGSTAWENALEVIRVNTASFGVVMFPIRGALPYIPSTKSMEECFEVYVRDGWVARDERTLRGGKPLIRMGAVTDRDFMSDAQLKKSPFYQEFLARNGMQGWVAIRVGSGENIWALTLHRTVHQESFSSTELATLRRLSVQLGGAAEIANTLGIIRGDAALAAFDLAGKAALLLNRDGEVVRANEMAEKLLDADITITKARLHCSDPAATDRLDRALKRLLWSLDVCAVPPIALPRLGRSPIIVHLMRSSQLADTPLSSFHAIAVLVNPDARLTSAVSTLREMLDLTPAEARLAIALQSGNELRDAPSVLNISPETARKQLRAIFAKTGVGRQADLIAFLSNLLPKI